MPVRNMTDDERDRIFGNGLIIFGQVRPTTMKIKEPRIKDCGHSDELKVIPQKADTP
jgi:hypothetical protein